MAGMKAEDAVFDTFELHTYQIAGRRPTGSITADFWMTDKNSWSNIVHIDMATLKERIRSALVECVTVEGPAKTEGMK